MGNESIHSRGTDRSAFRIAAYLEEAGEEPAQSCDTLIAANIPYIALKHVWTGNVCDMPDNACQKLKKIITDREMTVILIASEIGYNVPADSINQIPEDRIDRAFNLAHYFDAPYVKIGIGTKCQQDSLQSIDEWMSKITQKAISYNVTPVLEITDNMYTDTPSSVANQLVKHPRWKILYDPVQFILKRKIDPFIKYWTLIKQNVVAIDVRDLKIGRGFKPAGFGDSKIDLTIKDAINSKYKGWFILEPCLGRKHGSALTRPDTFRMALEAFDTIIDQ